jgi:hypothetical protein
MTLLDNQFVNTIAYHIVTIFITLMIFNAVYYYVTKENHFYWKILMIIHIIAAVIGVIIALLFLYKVFTGNTIENLGEKGRGYVGVQYARVSDRFRSQRMDPNETYRQVVATSSMPTRRPVQVAPVVSAAPQIEPELIVA